MKSSKQWYVPAIVAGSLLIFVSLIPARRTESVVIPRLYTGSDGQTHAEGTEVRFVTRADGIGSTVQLARQFIAERQLRNVEVVHADARATGLPRASFDLVHARLVLVNLPEPRNVVEEMIALVRPGGVVASHEADWGVSLCHPPSPAWDRFLGVFEAFSRNNGIDLRVGRKIYQIFRAAGLIDVHVTPVIHCEPLGTGRRNILCELVENLRDAFVTQGLLSEVEGKEQLAELKRHLNDAGTLVIPHLFLQVWGRKPE